MGPCSTKWVIGSTRSGKVNGLGRHGVIGPGRTLPNLTIAYSIATNHVMDEC